MTLSQQIRKAALGPTPKEPDHITGWFPYEPWVVVMLPSQLDWFCAWDFERRMFLLFVAEALE